LPTLPAHSDDAAAPIAGQLGSAFGRVSALAQRAALRIGQNDRWILAEALCRGVPVLTADATMHRLGALVVERLDDPMGMPLTVPWKRCTSAEPVGLTNLALSLIRNRLTA
jgi:hypothetical protein